MCQQAFRLRGVSEKKQCVKGLSVVHAVSCYEMSYRVDSTFHKITRITKTQYNYITFRVKHSILKNYRFFVGKLLACFVRSTRVHGNYRICALHTDANSLSLIFDVVCSLHSSFWVIESDCVRYRPCENKLGNLLGV